MERRREFGHGKLATYVYLKKAFESLHRDLWWDLLYLQEILAEVVALLTSINIGTKCCEV